MSTVIRARYLGDAQVEVEHGPTGHRLVTDLPPDNGGKGRTFSPTDHLVVSTSSCILTIMAELAHREGVDLAGATLDLEKEMTSAPRRVSRLAGTVRLPPGVPPDLKPKLVACIRACPVSRSLHPDLDLDITVEG